ncbi:MAG: twin-arginine translocation signal domain-containing protein [bacterium]|nr:twin-arginine translocation signal domain-containing protein [bacterium]MDE0242713.1 twin-arginine translocation signal domain-containing protein [bacterium]MDE0418397.1 twin-arginine translocation signal domain-containing protein [bacterium]
MSVTLSRRSFLQTASTAALVVVSCLAARWRPRQQAVATSTPS